MRLLERRNIAVAAAEEVPINIVNGRVEALFFGHDGALAYQNMSALEPETSNRRFVGWAAFFVNLGAPQFTAVALGDDKQVIALRTRPDHAMDDPAVRSVLTDPLSIPPFLHKLISGTSEAHQYLREFAKREIFGSVASDTTLHARTAAANLSGVFVDMMSEDWQYLSGTPGSTAFGRGRPVDIFKTEGAWPLFAPRASALNAYIRASIVGPKSTGAWRAVKAHAEEIERHFGIRLIEKMNGKTRFWL